MRRPISSKQRTMLTLKMLFKYTDENHRLNRVKLNKHLEPYGIECKKKVLNDTVDGLNACSISVGSKGDYVWLKDRPISDEDLSKLIFAITTTPYFTNEQAHELLQKLKPLVTVFQEERLNEFVETNIYRNTNPNLFNTYTVISSAIEQNRRVRYSVDLPHYNKENKTVSLKRHNTTLLTPKLLYQVAGRIYVVGYDHYREKVLSIDINKIKTIKLSLLHDDIHSEAVQLVLKEANPKEYIPEEKENIIYSGPITVYFHGRHLDEVYDYFGPPCGQVTKCRQYRTTYKIENFAVTDKTLLWLSKFENHAVSIVEPKEAVKSIRAYYANIQVNLTSREKQ